MKNLAILAVILFSASICNAQHVHSSDYETRVKSKEVGTKTADVVLSIPMMGNVKVKDAGYKFQKASMAFQIEQSNKKAAPTEYAVVEDSVQATQVKTEERMTAKHDIKMEE